MKHLMLLKKARHHKHKDQSEMSPGSCICMGLGKPPGRSPWIKEDLFDRQLEHSESCNPKQKLLQGCLSPIPLCKSVLKHSVTPSNSFQDISRAGRACRLLSKPVCTATHSCLGGSTDIPASSLLLQSGCPVLASFTQMESKRCWQWNQSLLWINWGRGHACAAKMYFTWAGPK